MGFIKTIVSTFYLFASLFSTSVSQKKESEREKPINYVKFADEVTGILIKEIQRDLGYKCEVTGGSMPEDIEGMTVGFSVYEKASVDRAREIEVEIIERFLRIINSHEKIRPFLREYPFPAKGTNIELRFYDRKKRDRQVGDCISHVFQANGKIYYFGSSPIEEYEPVEVANEKYEDALKIVKENRSISL